MIQFKEVLNLLNSAVFGDPEYDCSSCNGLCSPDCSKHKFDEALVFAKECVLICESVINNYESTVAYVDPSKMSAKEIQDKINSSIVCSVKSELCDYYARKIIADHDQN